MEDCVLDILNQSVTWNKLKHGASILSVKQTNKTQRFILSLSYMYASVYVYGYIYIYICQYRWKEKPGGAEDLLKLQSQALVTDMCTGNQTWVIWKSSVCS